MIQLAENARNLNLSLQRCAMAKQLGVLWKDVEQLQVIWGNSVYALPRVNGPLTLIQCIVLIFLTAKSYNNGVPLDRAFGKSVMSTRSCWSLSHPFCWCNGKLFLVQSLWNKKQRLYIISWLPKTRSWFRIWFQLNDTNVSPLPAQIFSWISKYIWAFLDSVVNNMVLVYCYFPKRY